MDARLRLRVLVVVVVLWAAGETRAQFLSDCQTERASITATPATYHFERPNDYRERHLGVGFEHVCDDLRGAGGVIPQNSNDDITLYAVAAWTPLAWRELHGGIFGGFFTGYSRLLLPAGGLIAAWDGRRYGANVLWFPPYEEHKGLLVLQLKRMF